ncbi:MAG TPA: STAS domain-containing protein [Candidatus Gastranaerophilales bacterium]|nr:STAS domain-containing protein [Candidatus Gastranaerophilales bacterium]
MNLLIKNLDKNVFILQPIISAERSIESIIGRVKLIVLENPEQRIVLDLRKINFLDSIKIGAIIGTYHFLEFSGKRIYLLVNNEEVKKSIENLSFSNIEIFVGYDKLALESIA